MSLNSSIPFQTEKHESTTSQLTNECSPVTTPDPLSALLARFPRRLGDWPVPGGTEELDHGGVDGDRLLAL